MTAFTRPQISLWLPTYDEIGFWRRLHDVTQGWISLCTTAVPCLSSGLVKNSHFIFMFVLNSRLF